MTGSWCKDQGMSLHPSLLTEVVIIFFTTKGNRPSSAYFLKVALTFESETQH